MTDDLTPEEKDALQKLPRERMPMGLEGRVVEAMREHGFLAKRRRAIEITNSRVVGLLAACVALVIGGYSIGLHRGGGDQVLPGVATVVRDERAAVEAPAIDAPEKKTERSLDNVREAEQPVVTDADRRPIPESKPARAESPSALPSARSDAAKANRAPEIEAREPAKIGQELQARPSQEAPTPQVVALESRGLATSEAPVASKRSLTFLLNGKPMVVKADSVRVTTEDRGRILIIYTSEGIIRIPLADDD